MEISKKVIEQILVDFVLYEKQGVSFYTKEDATEYLKTYMNVVEKLTIPVVSVPKDTLRSHLEALTKDIENSHNYGFDDVLSDYLKRNAL